MPHLAPLSWILVSIIFWITLLSFVSLTWWAQTPSFPKANSSFKPAPFTSWKWYLSGREPSP
nr:ATP synthase subunit 8 [Chloeia pocicola]